jgi:chemotaxis protein methyltransferase WspC
VFDVLRSFAATRTALPGPRPLRVLCAPCASGEEPFSVAMTLLTADWSAASFTIDAVDVSRACLSRAASGTYLANAFRNHDRSFRDRWFQADGAAFRLDDVVRRAVNFSWGNILDESFVAGRDPYDVIFCRNLLIYLTAEARAGVEQVLERLLAPDGILILGAAEPPILREPWIPAAEHASFALRRGPRPHAGRPLATASAPARPRSAASADSSPPPAALGHSARDRSCDTPPALLHEAGRLANAGRHAEALQLCQRHERASGATPELSFLMAMIHHSAGDPHRAEACLHKTLSLDPGHEEALLSLGLAASRRGDTALAEHYRQSAARAFARKEDR